MCDHSYIRRYPNSRSILKGMFNIYTFNTCKFEFLIHFFVETTIDHFGLENISKPVHMCLCVPVCACVCGHACVCVMH